MKKLIGIVFLLSVIIVITLVSFRIGQKSGQYNNDLSFFVDLMENIVMYKDDKFTAYAACLYYDRLSKVHPLCKALGSSSEGEKISATQLDRSIKKYKNRFKQWDYSPPWKDDEELKFFLIEHVRVKTYIYKQYED